MISALYAVVGDNGFLRILKVPVSRSNERFFVLTEPYPLPNGTNKRIFSRTEAIIPDTPINAALYYIDFVRSQRDEHQMLMQQWDKRTECAEKLIERLEAGEEICCDAV